MATGQKNIYIFSFKFSCFSITDKMNVYIYLCHERTQCETVAFYAVFSPCMLCTVLMCKVFLLVDGLASRT